VEGGYRVEGELELGFLVPQAKGLVKVGGIEAITEVDVESLASNAPVSRPDWERVAESLG